MPVTMSTTALGDTSLVTERRMTTVSAAYVAPARQAAPTPSPTLTGSIAINWIPRSAPIFNSTIEAISKPTAAPARGETRSPRKIRPRSALPARETPSAAGMVTASPTTLIAQMMPMLATSWVASPTTASGTSAGSLGHVGSPRQPRYNSHGPTTATVTISLTQITCTWLA